MMELTRALAMIPRTPSRCRTAIMTFSGGAGILSCDLLEEQGLVVAELSPGTKAELAQIYPDWLPVTNPVDLFPAFGANGAAAAYLGAFTAILKDPQVDVIFIHYFAGLDRDFEQIKFMKEAADKAGKILILWVLGLHQSIRCFRQDAEACGVPAHGELSRAVECLAAASRYEPQKPCSPRSHDAGDISLPSFVRKLLKEGNGKRVWDEFDSKRLLKECNIPVVEERIILSAKEAIETAQEIGYPVVLKGLIPGEVHKTESGLVRLEIASPSELKAAFKELKARMKGEGRILIQRQVQVEYELIAGFLRDGQFGPCVMFGLGGVFSELQRDVVFALAPLVEKDALVLLGRIKGKKLLQGFRGMAPLDEEAMADILVRLGDLGTACPEIEQIDINPLAVSQRNPVAVDATVILKTA